MTAVVAYSDGTKVWLAGDSFCGDESKKDICEASKVYQIGNLGIGICGYVRQELILESILRSINPSDFSDEWLRFVLPDILHDTMKAKGAVVEKDGQSTFGNSHYILALSGKLYYLESDFGVWEVKKNIAAIGAGREYTLGALSATPKSLKEDPAKALVKALKIASEWSPWVVGPYSVIEVE